MIISDRFNNFFTALQTEEGTSSKPLPSRSEVAKEHTWKLEDIYASEEEMSRDSSRVEELLRRIESFQGKVMSSAKSLLDTIALEEEISFMLGKIYLYSNARSHEDMNATGPKVLADKATSLLVKVNTAASFIVPEILEQTDATIYKYIDELPELEQYRLMLKRLIDKKPHILSKEEEAMMASFGEVTETPENVFSMLTNADMQFPSIKDENGVSQCLTQENYSIYIRSRDRRVRHDSFVSLHGTYDNFANTLGATFSASVKKDALVSRLRNYDDSLHAALSGNEIPVEVYHQLIKSVNENLKPLHDYVDLKKKVLNLDAIKPWDLYVSLSSEDEKTYSYDQAKDLVKDALKPLGDEYLKTLDVALSDRWIDVYENKGKRSGAYSWGTYGVHPYMLLNYYDTFRDVSTLAHEAGHSLHTWYSNGNQPQVYSGYSIFVAEVASTVNESLLLEYLLAKTEDKNERIFLIEHQLEQIRLTIYRQTLFAEFELKVHEMVEQGDVLTPENLKELWHDLNKRYYGELEVDHLLDIEWARIPHFYGAFYVYQYATGQSAALALVDMILNEGEEATQKYLSLLKGGSSKTPIELLKDAGVDMTTREPVERALHTFAQKVDELKSLLS